jgi:hypothetical protein
MDRTTPLLSSYELDQLDGAIRADITRRVVLAWSEIKSGGALSHEELVDASKKQLRVKITTNPDDYEQLSHTLKMHGHVFEVEDETTLLLSYDNTVKRPDCIEDPQIIRSSDLIGAMAEWRASAAEFAHVVDLLINLHYTKITIQVQATPALFEFRTCDGVYHRLKHVPSKTLDTENGDGIQKAATLKFVEDHGQWCVGRLPGGVERVSFFDQQTEPTEPCLASSLEMIAKEDFLHTVLPILRGEVKAEDVTVTPQDVAILLAHGYQFSSTSPTTLECANRFCYFEKDSILPEHALFDRMIDVKQVKSQTMLMSQSELRDIFSACNVNRRNYANRVEYRCSIDQRKTNYTYLTQAARVVYGDAAVVMLKKRTVLVVLYK